MKWWQGSLGIAFAAAVACGGASRRGEDRGTREDGGESGVGGRGGGRGGSGPGGGEAGNAEAGASQGGTSGGTGENAGSGGTAGSSGSDGGVPKPPPGDLAFAEGQVLEIRLTLDAGDWTALEERGNEEEFVPASVTVRGDGFPEVSFASVGLRHKGAWSLHHCWDEFGGVRNREDECRKLSYKIKFDKYDVDGRFDGLKRINLHASSGDATKLRELLAYSTFADFGLKAPRTSPARVVINGELQGLFIAVEEIDGRFTKRHFPEGGDGNLYKEIWPRTEQADEDFVAALETNEEIADVSDVRAFAVAVAGATNATFTTDMQAWVDLEQILRYMAVDRALKNWDGINAFYSPHTPHNFFWYHDDGADNRFHLVPWDLDNTLWEFDPYTHPEQWVTAEPVPDWSSEPADCTPRPVWDPAGSTTITPPRCDPFLDMLAETSWDAFVELGNELLDGPMSASALSAKVSYRRTQLAPLVAEDPTLDEAAWADAVDAFATTLARARTDFRAFLDAGLVSEAPRAPEPTEAELDAETLDTGLHVDGMTNFEFAMAPPLPEPGYTYVYGDSLATYVASWNTVAPLSGNADLLFDFTFNQQPGTYDEFVGMGIATEAEQDISSLTRVVVTLATDVPRTVRVRFASPIYDDTWGGIWSEFGIDLSVDSTPRAATIPFTALKYPAWAKAEWTTGQGFDVPDEEARLMVLQRFGGLVFAPAATFDEAGNLLVDPESGFLRVDNIYFR